MKKQTGNRLLSIVLSLAMLLSLLPVSALTAFADSTWNYTIQYGDESFEIGLEPDFENYVYVSSIQNKIGEMLNLNPSFISLFYDETKLPEDMLIGSGDWVVVDVPNGATLTMTYEVPEPSERSGYVNANSLVVGDVLASEDVRLMAEGWTLTLAANRHGSEGESGVEPKTTHTVMTEFQLETYNGLCIMDRSDWTYYYPIDENGAVGEGFVVTAINYSDKTLTLAGWSYVDGEPVAADQQVGYLYYDNSYMHEGTTPAVAYKASAENTIWEDGEWYVVSEDVTFGKRIIVKGTVHLVLCDGATMTAPKGISVLGKKQFSNTTEGFSTLNIYAQSGGTGTLYAGTENGTDVTCGDENAAIGGIYEYGLGTLNIHGGNVIARSDTGAAIGGGGGSGDTGIVNIYGGNVDALCTSSYPAAIGCGYGGNSEEGYIAEVNVLGGTVTAKSPGQWGSQGIGKGGYDYSASGSLTIAEGATVYSGTSADDCEIDTDYASTRKPYVRIEAGELPVAVASVTSGETTTYYSDFATALENWVDGSTLTLLKDVETTSTITVSSDTRTFDLNDYSITLTGTGSVFYVTGGNLTINNGTITGGNGGYDKRGGGFHVSGGSVTVNQVTISENTASWGGGVYLSGGSFTMNDSHLDGNHSVTDGNGWHDAGGAYLDGGVFTINGGSVKNNTVTEGKRNGLLLAGSSATLNISGDVVIYDNLDGNQQENLFADALFGGSSPLNIVGPLGPNAKIGIRASLGQVLTSSPNPEYNDPTKFVSDNSDYAVCKNADGQLFLGILVSSVEVTEIDAPVVGEALDTTAATATPNVTLGELSWTPAATPAAYATVYTATVIATASANAVFTDGVTATVNGEEATVTKNTDGTLSISWTFEKTPLEPIEITAEDKEVTYSPEGFDVPAEGMFTIPETAGTASYTVTEGSGEGSYDAQTGKLTVTKSGTFTVTVNTEATDTHAAAAASATLTVNPASVTLTANSGTETYDGTEKTVTGFTASIEGLSFPDVNASGSGTNAGDYDVSFSGVTLNETKDSSGNYVITAVTPGKLTVNPKAATVVADAKSKTYGAADPELTATVDGTVGADTLNYTLSRVAGENVGDYEITVTLGENPNYAITTDTATFTISKKGATVTPNAAGKIYGDADPELTAVVEGLIENESLNYTLSRVPGENVGEYEITVTLGENPNYEIVTETATFTISPKAASITAVDATKTYGNADPELTATVDGTVGADTLNYTLTRMEGENVGEYEITVTLGENPNYEITTTGATFTITKRAATLTADDKTKTYGDADPELTATAEGVVEGDTLNYTLSRAEGENVGEYEITVTLGENPNYEITTATGKLTVTRKAATVTADDLSKVFGEADPELTATVVGAVGEETLNYSLTRAPGEDAGEYAITVTLGENPNYDVTVGEDGVFTIDPAQVEVLIVGHNSTVVYDRETHTVRGYDFEADDERYLETYFSFSGNAVAERKNAGTTQMGLSEEQFTNNNANFAVTFTVIDGWQKIEPKLVENPFYVIGGGAQYYDGTEKRPGIKVFDDDTLVPSSEYTVSYSENVNAGTAIITVQNVDGNYVVNGETSFVILPKNASINPGEKGKMYGDNDPMLSAIVSGVVNGDTLDYTLNRTAGENAGEYLIYVTVGENPNYNLTTRTAVFTIFPKAAIVTPNDVSKLYGAADPELTATVEGLVGNDTLNYSLSRAPGENVGQYEISVTLGQNPNYEVMVETGVFTIGTKEITITPNAASKTYGDADPVLTAVVEGTTEPIAYELVRATGENAGEYEITVVLGDNPNYAITTGTATFTIDPKAAVVEANGASKVYGDTDPEFAATVEGLVGTDTLNYTLTRAEGENVGEYEITVTLGENPNYDVTATNGTFTITKKAATVTAVDATKVYGDTDPEFAATVEGLVGTDTLNYTLTRAEGENVGEYEITVTLGENPNYDVTATNGTFTITKKAATVTAVDATKVYGDTDPEFAATVEGLVGTDTLNYTLTRAEGENVGEYEITVTLGENPNYDVTASNGTFTITKKAATVTAVDATKVYGDTDPEFAATVEGLVGTDTLNYTLARTEGENVGEYEITVTLGENPNYDVTATNGTFTITKKAATVTAVDATKVYGDADPEFAATVEGLVGTDTLNYTLTRTEGENVGEYEITVTLGENPNYDVTTANGTFTITKKAATVTAVAATKVYGDADPELTATVTGLIGEDALNYTLARTEGENVGEYEITVTLGENPNYDVTATNGTFTITKKAATVTAVDATKVYGDADPEFAATVEGLVGTDTLNYTLTRTEGENVGEYEITVTLGENPNYDVTATNGTFTITKKAATVTAVDATKIYGDADPELTATVTGLIGEDALNYTLSRAEGENVGEYVITVTLGENPNYDVTTANGTFTITKKAATVTAVDATKTYGDADPEFAANVEGLVGTDTLNYTLTRTEGENVGEYEITVTLGENPNYDVTAANGTFTITKKAATVTAVDATKVYGDADPELTAAVEGLVGEDSLNYTLIRTEGENVGEYEITVTLGENPNYDVTATNGTFTITKKAATVTAVDATKVYGETDPEFAAAVEGLVGNDSLNYTLARAEGENVGEYVITVTLGENPNYDVTATNGTFTITKKAASITVADKSKVYGTNDPVLTATVSGLVNDDTLAYTLVRAEGENVGEYAITAVLGQNPNYDVTVNEGKLTIVKKTVTVKADAKTKVYGDADPALTATVTGLVGNDTLNYTLTRAEGENVGEYEITVTLGENPNYDVIAESGTLAITQKAATLTIENLSKVYGAEDPELTAVVDGLIGEDTLDYTLSRAAGENVGDYAIKAVLGSNPNYNVTVFNGTFRITKKAATITLENASKVYGDPDPALPATVTGLVGEDELNYTLTRAAGENVGEYKINMTLGENPNYDVTVIVGIATFTITPKAASVTANDATKVYGEDDPELSAAVEGLVGEDTLNYTLSRAEGENVGEYEITVTLGENPNYDVTVTNGVFTITKAAQEAPEAPTAQETTDHTITLTPVEGMEYRLGEDGEWQTSNVFENLETGTKYTFYQRLAADENHEPSEASEGAVISTSNSVFEKFVDVPDGSYFYDPVYWAVAKGITAGTDETHFSPDLTCTRGQIVMFLWRAAGSPEPTATENKFTDVKKKDYYYKAVLWAVENEITAGTGETTFSPDLACSRGQIVTFLWRYAGSPEPVTTENKFTDVKAKDYYYKAVLWAVENEITAGTGETTFGPKAPCTRAQIVTFLYQYMVG